MGKLSRSDRKKKAASSRKITDFFNGNRSGGSKSGKALTPFKDSNRVSPRRKSAGPENDDDDEEGGVGVVKDKKRSAKANGNTPSKSTTPDR